MRFYTSASNFFHYLLKYVAFGSTIFAGIALIAWLLGWAMSG
jgi:hypothetical protein